MAEANQRPEGMSLEDIQAEEMKALEIFQKQYGKNPSTPEEWDEIQVIAWGKLPIYNDIINGFIDALPDKISEEDLLKEAKKFYDPWFEYLLGDVVKQAEKQGGWLQADKKKALKRANESLISFREDIQRNKNYTTEDLNLTLNRLGTKRGWEQDEYDAYIEREGRQWEEASRQRDEGASARGLYRSGIREQQEDYLGAERQSALDAKQRQLDRTMTGYDWQEADAKRGKNRQFEQWNKNLADYERQSGYQTSDIKQQYGRDRYTLDEWLNKQKKNIGQKRQEAYGSYVTNPEYKYSGYGFSNVY
jgi:hypothetical protein